MREIKIRNMESKNMTKTKIMRKVGLDNVPGQREQCNGLASSPPHLGHPTPPDSEPGNLIIHSDVVPSWEKRLLGNSLPCGWPLISPGPGDPRFWRASCRAAGRRSGPGRERCGLPRHWAQQGEGGGGGAVPLAVGTRRWSFGSSAPKRSQTLSQPSLPLKVQSR